MGTKKNPPGGAYDVGYKHPPVHTRFTSKRQPARRGRKRNPNSNEVLAVLNEDIPVHKGGRRKRISSYEASVRMLVAKALKEKHLDNAIEFIGVCERHGILELMPPRQSGGVVMIPRDWDHDEWMAMFHRLGPPPWPGPRSGLTKYQEEQAMTPGQRRSGSGARASRSSPITGADPAKPVGYRNPPRDAQFTSGKSGNPNGRPSRASTRKEIVQRIARETLVVKEGNDFVERDTLTLVLLVIRSRAHEGNRKAFQIHERLLDRHESQAPADDVGYLVLGEAMTKEEWRIMAAEQQRPHREGRKTGSSTH